jgi:hypothetical protein
VNISLVIAKPPGTLEPIVSHGNYQRRAMLRVHLIDVKLFGIMSEQQFEHVYMTACRRQMNQHIPIIVACQYTYTFAYTLSSQFYFAAGRRLEQAKSWRCKWIYYCTRFRIELGLPSSLSLFFTLTLQLLTFCLRTLSL